MPGLLNPFLISPDSCRSPGCHWNFLLSFKIIILFFFYCSHVPYRQITAAFSVLAMPAIIPRLSCSDNYPVVPISPSQNTQLAFHFSVPFSLKILLHEAFEPFLLLGLGQVASGDLHSSIKPCWFYYLWPLQQSVLPTCWSSSHTKASFLQPIVMRAAKCSCEKKVLRCSCSALGTVVAGH